MKIIKNEKLIKRNSKIGTWVSLAGMVIIFAVAYFAFQALLNPETASGTSQLFIYGGLIIGILISQISIYFGSRWGRSPRPDEKLDAGLKGLPGDFVIYHWMTPASHLLVGPAGVWVLLPYSLRGKVTYQKNRWRLSGGGFMQTYMRIFGQEGIGRPDLEAEAEIAAVRKALATQMDESEIPDIKAALVFTDEPIEIEAKDSPYPALPLKKLKDFMRNKAKEKPIPAASLQAVKAVLPE